MPKNEVAIFEIKKRNTGDFLREILEGLTVDGGRWIFPKRTAGNGCTGTYCISEGNIYRVASPAARHTLLYHLNFRIIPGTMVKSNGANRGRLDVTVSQLHNTARSTKCQDIGSENGFSILTAQRSVHCGPGNDWDFAMNKHDSNMTNLSHDLNVTVEELKTTLRNGNLGLHYMMRLVPTLRQSLKNTIEGHLPNIDVTVLGI